MASWYQIGGLPFAKGLVDPPVFLVSSVVFVSIVCEEQLCYYLSV